MSIEKTRAFSIEHNIVNRNRVILKHDSTKVVPKVSSAEGSLTDHKEDLKNFNTEVDKRIRVKEVLNKNDLSTYSNVFLEDIFLIW